MYCELFTPGITMCIAGASILSACISFALHANTQLKRQPGKSGFFTAEILFSFMPPAVLRIKDPCIPLTVCVTLLPCTAQRIWMH